MGCGYRTSYNHHHGWGHRGFSPVPFLFGLLVLFMIFKTGLWIPLLVLGVIAFTAIKSKARHWHWDEAKMREWGEKAKREFDSWEKPKRDRPYTYIDTNDKPKRGDDGFDYV